MSITTKKRLVMNQICHQYFLPKADEMISRILECRGGNLMKVEDSNGEVYLASMPSKFRKVIWVKRGSFVFLTPIEEGNKVKAEITQVIDTENILYIREQNLWPERFEIYAQPLTREAKRGLFEGVSSKHDMIDDDMLPPSDDEHTDDNNSTKSSNDNDHTKTSDDSDENKSQYKNDGNSEKLNNSTSEESSSDEEENRERRTFRVCNPNRTQRLL